MLGVGLHAYGFMDKGFKWLVLFVASQVAFTLIAMVPLRRWRSFREQSAGPSDNDGPKPPAPVMTGSRSA